GLVASFALSRFAQTLLFHISPVDPIALSGAAVLMLTVAAAAALLPAHRAASVDPIAALRAD
ncbi:MAG TPA: hypothetical protein VMY76_07960, partial [Gemmatimonadales bacterium]|nr:hypothetical protein [Gemmatimonadales bacterium]